MAQPSAETKVCEKLLSAIAARKLGAMDALRTWIEEQPGYDFSRTRTLGECMKDARFSAALVEVVPWKQLLDLGCPQNPVREAAVEEMTAWLAKHPKEAPARAKAILDLAAKTPRKQREWRTASFLCMPHVAVLPKTYDALLVPLCAVYRTPAEEKALLSALAKIPVARRDAILEVAIAEGAWERSRISKAMLALASKELCARLKARDAATAQKAKAAAVVERAAKAGAPYRFVTPLRVLPRDYAALDEIGKAQYRAVAGSYVESGKVKDPKDFIRQLKKEELNEGDAELRRWKVMCGKEHVFDLWVVWVDNGAFFEAGTSKPLPVYIAQGSYLPRDRKAATKKLASDLALSEPKSLWALA